MNPPVMTLGERWPDHFLAGINWIHRLGSPANARIVPKSDPTPEILVRALQAIANGRFETSDDLLIGNPPKPALVSVPPPLSPETDYLLIGLNAESARGRFASLPSGGVVFEDPIWALLAAHAVSRKDRAPVAVPCARDDQDLWEHVLVLAGAIEERRYRPEDFFEPIEDWIPPSRAPRFELLTVSSEQLAALRLRGIQALKVSRPPKFFELYQPSIRRPGEEKDSHPASDVDSGRTNTVSPLGRTSLVS
jgi:hypothetical protein